MIKILDKIQVSLSSYAEKTAIDLNRCYFWVSMQELSGYLKAMLSAMFPIISMCMYTQEENQCFEFVFVRLTRRD